MNLLRNSPRLFRVNGSQGQRFCSSKTESDGLDAREKTVREAYMKCFGEIQNTNLKIFFHPFLWFKELNATKTKELLLNYPVLCKEAVNINDVNASAEYLKENNILAKNIRAHPLSLLVHKLTLANRKKVLEECSFGEIKLQLLHRFVALMNKKVHNLKAFNYISQESNVAENLLKQLDVDIKLKTEIGDDITLAALRDVIIKNYLKAKLRVTEKDFSALSKVHHLRLKHRSLESTVKIIDVLVHKLNFSKERIFKNGFVLYACADNINQILTEVPEIGGVPMSEVLHRRPKIIMNSAESIRDIVQLIKRRDIPEKNILGSLEILTLAPGTIQTRLEHLSTVKEFDALDSNPRFLRLVHYHKKAKSRLDCLKQMNVKCASLNLLSSASEVFEKYARDGADKTSGRDSVMYVAKCIGQDMEHVRNTFTRHPNWRHVPLTTVKASIDFLRSKSFTDEDIGKNLYLLLYPVSRIEEKLSALKERQAGNNENDRINDIPLSEVSNSKLLSLCLYFIEVEFHFSGDGIWDTNKHDHKQDISPTTIPEFSKKLENTTSAVL